MTNQTDSLARLYASFDDRATGRDRSIGGDRHAAVLQRLAENQREAEQRGWTSCELERVGGLGRLEALGVPPSETQRRLIPDWQFESPIA